VKSAAKEHAKDPEGWAEREKDVGITLEGEVQGRGDNIRHKLRGGRRVCYACEMNRLPTLLLMQQPPGWHSPGFYFGKYVVICNVATGENAFNLTYCCRRNQDPFVPACSTRGE
jgi:hypothetical protein